MAHEIIRNSLKTQKHGMHLKQDVTSVVNFCHLQTSPWRVLSEGETLLLWCFRGGHRYTIAGLCSVYISYNPQFKTAVLAVSSFPGPSQGVHVCVESHKSLRPQIPEKAPPSLQTLSGAEISRGGPSWEFLCPQRLREVAAQEKTLLCGGP